MRQRTRDPQQKAVYQWEGDWQEWNRSTASLCELREAVKWACRRYGVKVIPALKQHAGGAYSWTRERDGCRPEISMQAREQKNMAVVLHEVAHYICDEIFREKVQDHGPEFLGIFLGLLADRGVAPEVALHATASSHGLKWLSYAEIGPAAIKALAKAQRAA